MATINVDVRGETCPVSLVETRKALRKASVGDVVGRGAGDGGVYGVSADKLRPYWVVGVHRF